MPKGWNGNEIDLLPCPFCGGDAEMKHIGNDRSKKRLIEVKCKQCRATRTDGAIHEGFDWVENVVAKNWNARTGQ